MISKEHLLQQFEQRIFDESYTRIFKCLSLLDEKHLWKKINPNVPAVGNLVLHLSGNARQWILSGLGGQTDNRQRDLEFETHKNIKKTDLIFLLENLRVNIQQCLRDVPESKYGQTYSIQGFTETGFSVLIHVIEHFSYHTGQITTLTKLQVNIDTGYYGDKKLT
ncbi:DUF1572 domain-containing protein [Crocinitomicaceae bacterium]|jgi:uncharacterized damage-inducible protein DinB|nr:DUF1572 domain-containing protein [Crocinitomicaceae bacterium]MDG2463998.1 DinB family protein [Crocinitomicaceae bacterium]